jgi:predicted amidohydrolase
VGDDDKLKGRLPGEYMQVAQSTYLWSPQKFFALYGDRQLPVGKKSVVTVAQFLPRRLAIDKNVKRISEIAEKAATAKSDLLVLPELATTGAVFTSRAEADGVAEGMDGITLQAVTSVAKRSDLFLVTSFVERDANRLYNTAVLVGKKGVVGKYRKIHLNNRDRVWATPGDLGFPTFDIPLGRVGLAIGHDSMFPESFRCLSADGADLICAPSALEYPLPIAGEKTSIPHPRPIPRGADPVHWHLWRVRAGENCTYVAFANQCGTESGSNFFGYSGIFQPDLFAFPRKETVAGSAEDVRSLTIDTSSPEPESPSNPVRAKYLLRMRQPYWYDPVVVPRERRRLSPAPSEPRVRSAPSPVTR